jgi:uncharacterized tellurite resistance protein B-like protein
MHIIIGIITALAGLLWALNSVQRSGFDLNSLNPLFWYRRRQWNKRYGQNPLYTIDAPLEVAAVLLLGIAKLEGDISKEHKLAILKIFSNEFGLGADDASELFASSSFLLQKELDLVKNVGKVLHNSIDKFTPVQIKSTLELMQTIASIESAATKEQQKLIQSVEEILSPPRKENSKWTSGHN